MKAIGRGGEIRKKGKWKRKGSTTPVFSNTPAV
jgi:hypothetical protein